MKKFSFFKKKKNENIPKYKYRKSYLLQPNILKEERFCSNCGEPLADDIKFCFYCGQAALPRDTSILEQERCPDCGAELKGELPICPNCERHVLGDVSQPY